MKGIARNSLAWLSLVIAGGLVNQAGAQTWSTATSTHAENGRIIVFRFIDDLGPSITPSSLPGRVIIQWRYEEEAEKGMPLPKDHEAMNLFEDLLEPYVEKGGFSVLALVSTGEHLREWVYYAKNEEEFIERLNTALSEHAPFPIEIYAAQDPEWNTWREFKAGLER